MGSGVLCGCDLIQKPGVEDGSEKMSGRGSRFSWPVYTRACSVKGLGQIKKPPEWGLCYRINRYGLVLRSGVCICRVPNE